MILFKVNLKLITEINYTDYSFSIKYENITALYPHFHKLNVKYILMLKQIHKLLKIANNNSLLLR
jgi:hypothetical protein